jgi:hypothetical protein
MRRTPIESQDCRDRDSRAILDRSENSVWRRHSHARIHTRSSRVAGRDVHFSFCEQLFVGLLFWSLPNKWFPVCLSGIRPSCTSSD